MKNRLFSTRAQMTHRLLANCLLAHRRPRVRCLRLTVFISCILLTAALLLSSCAPLLTRVGVSLPDESSATQPVPSTGGVPGVQVVDQRVKDGKIVVSDVFSVGPGWIVIHNQQNGNVGPAIGETAVKNGDNKNVVVNLDTAMVTPVLYAMLHTDLGKVGKYEFPGPDIAVVFNDQMVNPSFNVSILGVATPVIPSITVKSQRVQNGKVTVAEVDSNGPGWVAIHIQKPDGTPGVDIGFSAVKPGRNTDVVVTVDPARVTPTMFAMLHQDAGLVGKYEYPGPDGPLQINGSMVAPSFSTTGADQSPAAVVPTQTVSVAGSSYSAGTTSAAGSNSAAGTATPLPTESTGGMEGMQMATPSGDGSGPEITVTDQPLTNNAVKVRSATSPGPGWIVIYTTTESGQPDKAIGHTALKPGPNQDVVIPVDPSLAKGILYAQLHSDEGKVGVFEFPGPDSPLMVGVQMISGTFKIIPAESQGQNPSGSQITPAIKVADQPIKDSKVVIPEVDSRGEAWLVIHRQNGDGSMGSMVGFTRVKDGINTNVVVQVDTSSTSSNLYAMLHEDHGKIGTLEFPGPDVPVQVDGKDITPIFHVTSQAAADVVINLSTDSSTTPHLVDAHGRALYIYLKDQPGKSNCTGDCLTVWQPLHATGRVIAGAGVPGDRLGVILLPDGSRQVTYSGAPLYTNIADTQPGDLKGQGYDSAWFLVTP